MMKPDPRSESYVLDSCRYELKQAKAKLERTPNWRKIKRANLKIEVRTWTQLTLVEAHKYLSR